MQAMKIDYDNRFDTLYVALGDKSNSYGDDSLNDVILMRDAGNDEITGLTVLSFRRKATSPLLQKIFSELGISVEKDILPHIS